MKTKKISPTTYRSKIDKNVTFQKWDTPVSSCNDLFFLYLIRGSGNMYFFFQTTYREKKKSRFFIFKISRFSPMRMMEEEFAYSSVWKLFDSTRKRKKEDYGKTKIMWNTKFIRDVDVNAMMANYDLSKIHTIPQYLINTNDETIEIIPDGVGEWSEFKYKDINKIISKILKTE